MLQDRDAEIEERASRLTEKEAVADRRTEELVVTFAALEERRHDVMKVVDEQAATSTARLRAWEEQLCCTEALLAERELESLRRADELRAAMAVLEAKQRAVAELEAILAARALSASAPRQAPVAAATEVVSPPVASSDGPSDAPSSPASATAVPQQPLFATKSSIEMDAFVEVDLLPSVDISDFTAEEVAQFNTRRRLGLRNDATLAAEIRSERVPTKKKGWWF
jgi:hypothetical protein